MYPYEINFSYMYPYEINFSVICKLTVIHFSQCYFLFFVSSCCSESSFIYLVAAAGVAAVGGVLFGYDIGMKFFALVVQTCLLS